MKRVFLEFSIYWVNVPETSAQTILVEKRKIIFEKKTLCLR